MFLSLISFAGSSRCALSALVEVITCDNLCAKHAAGALVFMSSRTCTLVTQETRTKWCWLVKVPPTAALPWVWNTLARPQGDANATCKAQNDIFFEAQLSVES